MDTLFFMPDGAVRDTATGLLPALPVPVNYPSSGAMTLLDLQGPDYNSTVTFHTHDLGHDQSALRVCEIASKSTSMRAGLTQCCFYWLCTVMLLVIGFH